MAELNSTSLISDGNLIAYWRFNGNLSDSKNSNNLSAGGTVSYTSSNWVSAVKMESGDITIGSDLTGTGSFTVTGWIKLPSEIGSGTWNIFDMGSSPSPSQHTNATYEYNSGNRRLYINRSKPGVGNDIVYSSTIALGTTWNHLCYVYNGSTLKIYLNNAEVGSGSASGTGTGGYADVFTLQNAVANVLYEDWAVFNKALNTTEIGYLATGGDPNIIAASSTGGSFLINFL